VFDACGFACGPCRATRTQFGGGGACGAGWDTDARCMCFCQRCFVTCRRICSQFRSLVNLQICSLFRLSCASRISFSMIPPSHTPSAGPGLAWYYVPRCRLAVRRRPSKAHVGRQSVSHTYTRANSCGTPTWATAPGTNSTTRSPGRCLPTSASHLEIEPQATPNRLLLHPSTENARQSIIVHHGKQHGYRDRCEALRWHSEAAVRSGRSVGGDAGGAERGTARKHHQRHIQAGRPVTRPNERGYELCEGD